MSYADTTAADLSGTTGVLYANGAQVASAASSGSPTSTTSEVEVGRRMDGGGTMFQGGIGYCAIYGFALSASQQANHHQAGLDNGVLLG